MAQEDVPILPHRSLTQGGLAHRPGGPSCPLPAPCRPSRPDPV